MDAMNYFDIIIHPVEAMTAEKKNVNVGMAHKSFAIYGAIIGLIFGLAIAFVGGLIGVAMGAILQSVPIVGLLFGLGMLAVIVSPLLMAILSVLFAFIGYHVLTFVANLFGGTGTFEENYYLGSRLLWPMLAAGMGVGILTMIPFLGFLIQIGWYFYTIYLMVLLISIANNIGKGKALIVFILPAIIITIAVAMVIGAALAGAIGASFAGVDGVI